MLLAGGSSGYALQHGTHLLPLNARIVETQDPSPSDQELVRQINAGNSGAFDVLYERHKQWVVDLAFRFTHDEHLALDVLQDAFLYLLRKFPGFVLTAQMRTFLYPVVRNLSLTARGKAERCQSDPDEMNRLADQPAADALTGGDDAFTILLSRIPEPQREVLWLRFVDGMSLEEIAGAMGIPLGTVKSRLHHALEAIREDPRTREFLDD